MNERTRIAMALTTYDERARKRKGWNSYALPQYFGALERADEAVKAGATWRDALRDEFCGRILDVAGKALDIRYEAWEVR